VEPLRVYAPDAELADLLRSRLASYRATAARRPDGTWLVEVPLASAPREAVPRTLAATRDWLEDCGLGATSVELDGHAHLIRAQRARASAGHAR
jgi:hypothetical protein